MFHLKIIMEPIWIAVIFQILIFSFCPCLSASESSTGLRLAQVCSHSSRDSAPKECGLWVCTQVPGLWKTAPGGQSGQLVYQVPLKGRSVKNISHCGSQWQLHNTAETRESQPQAECRALAQTSPAAVSAFQSKHSSPRGRLNRAKTNTQKSMRWPSSSYYTARYLQTQDPKDNNKWYY